MDGSAFGPIGTKYELADFQSQKNQTQVFNLGQYLQSQRSMLSENALSTYNTPRFKPRYDSFPLFKVQSNPSFQQDPSAQL